MNSREIKATYTSEDKMKHFSTLPSCFLTPESAEKPHDLGRVTPTPDRSSSVFLSPPTSFERKPVPNFGVHTVDDPLRLELDFEVKTDRCETRSVRSSLLPEDRIIGRKIGRDKVDLLSDLLMHNCSRICKSILSFVSDQDLCRCASVCREWRGIVKYQMFERWNLYLQQCKLYCSLKGKENIGSPSLKDVTSSKIQRTPFSNINVNTQNHNKQSIRAPNETTTRSTMASHSLSNQVVLASENLRPCPNCTSPSTFPKVHDGHCQCQRCGLEYCSLCLREMKYHKEAGCRGLDDPLQRTKRTKSRKKANDEVVGSRKNKERMKRL